MGRHRRRTYMAPLETEVVLAFLFLVPAAFFVVVLWVLYLLGY